VEHNGDNFCCLAVEAFTTRILIESLNWDLIKLIMKNAVGDSIEGGGLFLCSVLPARS
jgi:hypothetical protein